jgi:hypothetical protein
MCFHMKMRSKLFFPCFFVALRSFALAGRLGLVWAVLGCRAGLCYVAVYVRGRLEGWEDGWMYLCAWKDMCMDGCVNGYLRGWVVECIDIPFY